MDLESTVHRSAVGGAAETSGPSVNRFSSGRIWRAFYRTVWKLGRGTVSALRHGPAHVKTPAIITVHALVSKERAVVGWLSKPMNVAIVLVGLVALRTVRNWRR